MKFTARTALMLFFSLPCVAQEASQETPKSKPIELAVLKASIGVWDAEIEVWPEGPASPPLEFKGVETNRPYGEYWLSSDFDTVYLGQTMKVHSIVGYDLDRGKLVGTVIDHGPYAASMTGEYDEASKTVRWTTAAKGVDGTTIVQKTLVSQKTANERVLVLSVPGKEKNEFTKFMQIRYVKRE